MNTEAGMQWVGREGGLNTDAGMQVGGSYVCLYEGTGGGGHVVG